MIEVAMAMPMAVAQGASHLLHAFTHRSQVTRDRCRNDSTTQHQLVY